MRNSLETRLGLFFALGLLALVFIFEIIGGTNLFQSGVNVRALFTSIQELKKGDPVKMAGVDIGRVTAIELAGNKVEVKIKLTRPEQVKTDSKASIKFIGLLGQNYVAIEFGSDQAPPIEPDALLESTEQVDLNTIMVKLDNVAAGIENLARSFTGDSLNNLLGPFVDFIRQNSPRISAILSNVQQTTAQIVKGEGTVGKLISDDEVYRKALDAANRLGAAADDAKLTLGEAKIAITRINAGEGTVGKLLKDEALYNETSTAMTQLKEILQKVNQGQGSAGKFINDDSLFRNAKLTLQKVDKATQGLEDQGPLSVLGVIAGKLF